MKDSSQMTSLLKAFPRLQSPRAHAVTRALLPAHALQNRVLPTSCPTVFVSGGTLSSGTDLALGYMHCCALSSPGNVGIQWNQAIWG